MVFAQYLETEFCDLRLVLSRWTTYTMAPTLQQSKKCEILGNILNWAHPKSLMSGSTTWCGPLTECLDPSQHAYTYIFRCIYIYNYIIYIYICIYIRWELFNYNPIDEVSHLNNLCCLANRKNAHGRRWKWEWAYFQHFFIQLPITFITWHTYTKKAETTSCTTLKTGYKYNI